MIKECVPFVVNLKKGNIPWWRHKGVRIMISVRFLKTSHPGSYCFGTCFFFFFSPDVTNSILLQENNLYN